MASRSVGEWHEETSPSCIGDTQNLRTCRRHDTPQASGEAGRIGLDRATQRSPVLARQLDRGAWPTHIGFETGGEPAGKRSAQWTDLPRFLLLTVPPLLVTQFYCGSGPFNPGARA